MEGRAVVPPLASQAQKQPSHRWLADNWMIDASPLRNPGGNAVVIAIGAAAPIRTPIIVPPVPFN